MTDQPDRPDGDGLLPAPGTILQIGGASPSDGWGSNAIEVRESTGGVGWRWRAITAVENQWLIDALNAKVAPSTRDGAEGAGQNEIHSSDGGVGSQTRKELSADAQSLMAAGNVDSLGVAPGPSDFSSAPPKPAPDAMREAIAAAIKANPYTNYSYVAQNSAVESSRATKFARMIAAEAFRLSAPVPPADGALEKARQEVVLAISFLGRDSGTERLQATVNALIPGLVKADAVLRSFLVPSPAVAAEPVAWQKRNAINDWSNIEDCSDQNLRALDNAGWETRPLYASPPVRGDREAIARGTDPELVSVLPSEDK